MTESINYEGGCRTAPALPGVLIIENNNDLLRLKFHEPYIKFVKVGIIMIFF